MAAIEIPTMGGEVVGAGILAGRRARRRDSFEAIGLLVGILGILVAVALTLGTALPG